MISTSNTDKHKRKIQMSETLSPDQTAVLNTIKSKRNGKMALSNAMRRSNSIAMTLVGLGLVTSYYDIFAGVTVYSLS